MGEQNGDPPFAIDLSHTESWIYVPTIASMVSWPNISDVGSFFRWIPIDLCRETIPFPKQEVANAYEAYAQTASIRRAVHSLPLIYCSGALRIKKPTVVLVATRKLMLDFGPRHLKIQPYSYKGA